ncbi:RsmB/NOP family class I SAM-dependent RNA methyltransferase [Rhodobacteraceae bacterium N5(2021)]|uniref:RsmB/NOP family class I SAM-dependent RNA methyltransferase n=1 Tax=Gymnodinialimonas phycosphaerae TaxID=2841589 RepID=A0A975YGK2_9RHOB|nr:RsmB/NOP family class I SAM-dependent RNA methyltransferase [Gymnodinialimonas phycosphaerae]MBY4891792.1 RsmB/NOP family class I SAM-dependent RNA methyltransferase [Gymnodinialimonas phycosphaerae]
MQPAARYAAAIEVLDAWRDGAPVEQALTRWARGARYAGSKDRAAVRDHVYDVLRRKGSCEAVGGPAGRGLILGLARLQGLALDEIFSGIGHAPDPLDEAEREAERDVDAPPLDPALNVPDWTLPLLAPRAPDALADLLETFAHRAPLWLRVNLRRGTREAAARALAEDGLVTQPHSEVATALEVTEGARRLRQASSYLAGLVEPQDLSVQAAMQRVAWPDDGRILDYCAGGGGKALAIADRTRAQVFAHDALPQRMADLEPRATRADVRITPLTSDQLHARGPFDLVLTDVPCSGSGTWRRDPEAKWRLSPQALEELVKTQASILEEAADLVAPRGRLVYMTCSLFEAENEAQIAAFLARHPGWQAGASHCDTPLTASDGFFAAELHPL